MTIEIVERKKHILVVKNNNMHYLFIGKHHVGLTVSVVDEDHVDNKAIVNDVYAAVTITDNSHLAVGGMDIQTYGNVTVVVFDRIRIRDYFRILLFGTNSFVRQYIEKEAADSFILWRRNQV